MELEELGLRKNMFLRKFDIFKKSSRLSTWRKKKNLVSLPISLCLFLLLCKFHTVINGDHSTAFRTGSVGGEGGWRRHSLPPPPPLLSSGCAGGITFSNYTCPAHKVWDNIKPFPLRSTMYNAVAGSVNDAQTEKDLLLREKWVTWKNWERSMIIPKEHDVVYWFSKSARRYLFTAIIAHSFFLT